MYLLNYSFPSAIENIAFDEAFLEWCEGADPGSVIRLWESPEVAVVLGHGNQIHREADPEACRKRQIPILRRCSGGGTVVVGPGCFQYSFFLRNDDSAQLQSIGGTTDFVMDHLACLLQQAAEDGVLKPDRIPPRVMRSGDGGIIRCFMVRCCLHFRLPILLRFCLILAVSLRIEKIGPMRRF
ncbi:hypothetical protein EBR96_03790 [bacterium]|nr:hypothetical protein [bacterium]